MQIGKRLVPPDGTEAKVGDFVSYEVIYDDGSKGEITTILDKFDLVVGGYTKVGKVE